MFRFDDLRYLFNPSEDDSIGVYRRSAEMNRQVVELITSHYNKFSETFFVSWVSNVFLRYIVLCSNQDEATRLSKFEKVHVDSSADINWHRILQLYTEYADVKIKFVDFIDFIHTDEHDVIKLKICVVCADEKMERIDRVNEEDIHYYDIEFVKPNNKNVVVDDKAANYTSNCPCCGAPTSIVTFGICDHCKEMVSIYDNVWKIRNVELT